jgi:uncharacterized protein
MSVIRNFYDAMLDPICNRLMHEIPAEYKYHSLRHTLDVVEEAVRIGQSEGLSEYDLMLVRVAALFHDTGYIRQRKEHEEAGCTIFLEYAATWDLTQEEKDAVVGCIRATRIPQSPANLMERVVCDADLDYLGREDFEMIGELLFEELTKCGEIESRQQWNETQVRFLSKQTYHTRYSNTHRAAQLQVNLEHVKQMILRGI